MERTWPKRLSVAQSILRDLQVPLWLIVNQEDRDPTAKKLLGVSSIRSMVLLSPTQKRIVVSSLDRNNLPEDPDIVVCKTRADYDDGVIAGLCDLGFTDRVMVNYTTMGDVGTDRIGAGTRDWVDFLVARAFPEVVGRTGNIRDVVVSAENVIYALYDRKMPDEIAKMRVAARRANEILETAFAQLRPGMKDWDAYRLVHRIMRETRPDYFAEAGVVSETFSWPEDHNPIVLTGPSFTKGGHAMTCGETIEPGNTVYFDFGVKLTFQDGTSWSSDLQRMGYVLRDGETEASPESRRIFSLLHDSVTDGIERMRPGMRGWEVDEIVRRYITDVGYDYDHATGHPIGEEAHNPGTTLRPRQDAFGTEQLLIQPHGAYTIEPRIPIVNGGSIEEMVLVNPDGPNETFCPRQERLYLIPSR